MKLKIYHAVAFTQCDVLSGIGIEILHRSAAACVFLALVVDVLVMKFKIISKRLSCGCIRLLASVVKRKLVTPLGSRCFSFMWHTIVAIPYRCPCLLHYAFLDGVNMQGTKHM